MSKDILKEKNIELNHLYLKEERLYNNYASYCGLSLSSLRILYDLYALFKTDKSYMQSDIAKITSLSKQTVNSSIAGLIKKGYVELEHIEMTRNGKSVKLTKEGKNFCKKIIEPLIKAEENSLANMSEAEINTLIILFNKSILTLEKELEIIYKKSKRGDK